MPNNSKSPESMGTTINNDAKRVHRDNNCQKYIRTKFFLREPSISSLSEKKSVSHHFFGGITRAFHFFSYELSPRFRLIGANGSTLRNKELSGLSYFR